MKYLVNCNFLESPTETYSKKFAIAGHTWYVFLKFDPKSWIFRRIKLIHTPRRTLSVTLISLNHSEVPIHVSFTIVNSSQQNLNKSWGMWFIGRIFEKRCFPEGETTIMNHEGELKCDDLILIDTISRTHGYISEKTFKMMVELRLRSQNNEEFNISFQEDYAICAVHVSRLEAF